MKAMTNKPIWLIYTLLITCSINLYAQEWKIVFSDEFNGTSVNETAWRINTHNNEFTREALVVGNGVLRIDNSYPVGGNTQGGWIESRNDQFIGDAKYGYYEARIRITSDPNGKIWPTWWVWGKNWRMIDGVVNTDTATELDIMEYSGWAKKFSGNKATSSHHYQRKREINGKTHITTSSENAAQRNAFEWHTWGVYWTPTEISFYYDGEKYFESDQPGDAATEIYPMKLIFSSSPHKNNPTPELEPQPGETFPSFEIDWVRVWNGSVPGTNGCQGLPEDLCKEINNNLANDNFSVQVVSESCLNGNNGTIKIEAKKEFNYTAKIESANKTESFNKNANFNDLTPGDYSVCITYDENPDFSQCFDVLIKKHVE